MADKDGKKGDETAAAAQVWARDGEGPHSIVIPDTAATASPPSANALASVGVSLGPDQIAQEQTDAKDTRKVSDEGQDADNEVDQDLVEDNENQEAIVEDDGNEQQEQQEQQEQGEQDQSVQEESGAETPEPAGPPTQDDYVIGYTLPLVIYFVAYSLNALAGGYCLTSARVDALAEIFFFWTPALAAGCLLLGSRWLKFTGAVLILPLAGGALFAGQYFHLYERFQSEMSPYGPLAKVYEAKGWHICRYESPWSGGGAAAVTYTREKEVGPYIKYVKKMRLGEPP